MPGITAYSFYIPRSRLARQKIAAGWGTAQSGGAIAVANYDEDALTLGVEAALGCLDSTTVPDALFFASTSSPYAEKQVASVIATACDLPRSAQTADFAGSVRAGVSALVAAANAVRAGARRDVVVVASDCRLAAPESEVEGLLGDGAAAVRVGSDGVLAEIVDVAHVSEEFTHLWRTDEQRYLQAFPGKFSNTYGYVRDIADAVRAVLARNGVEAKEVAKLAVYAPDARAAADLCRKLGVDAKSRLVAPPVASIGSAGCADALLGLGAALDVAAPGDWIVVAGYGEGAEAVLLRATDALPAHRAAMAWQAWVDAGIPLPSYEKYLKHRRIVPVEVGGEAINNVLEYKELKQDLRLYGSRCAACGAVQYPIARVCIACGAREQLADHKLGKRGRIFTFTIDYLIANQELPLPMVVVDVEAGGRLFLQCTDFELSEVGIGKPVVLTYRRLHEGGGNRNYYWKARPPRGAAEEAR
jgi:3-hydroxy-3-methylglutaryl CoA synthase